MSAAMPVTAPDGIFNPTDDPTGKKSTDYTRMPDKVLLPAKMASGI